MSTLRPECVTSYYGRALSRAAVLGFLLESVSRRRSLAHGALHVGDKHCAMGCFWADYPNSIVESSVIDEVAAVNDLMPRSTPKNRWKRVMKWLRGEVAAL